ncbi:type II toxin-antitoxin system VapC family toxin [Neorhizobium galegae]|uniref:type II toxin-antitoxin system VapC family toxin n=1 Tax=Neorhizobium galegae TaxID=399 RepID=UPI00062207F4|nr:type II toxin-antitoxin system VapC family toxin [Neorhizobium galegae]CDZ26118.1 NtrR2 transcription regulator [Neorhizobium galegae bv. officinalis]KAA9388249.1 type II toxin-antitoxin system VapC family toxin [Neorhizobium galegae]MCM2497876.1 type II toxin-antitoxin system VapC family toxin [Neorhizobium galegae]MCQ1770098.1 type II toxin-antitoxin system VapC family toxin [Neorhizobium galegae]MCQ1779751.1 type II toxin-antitoxin system VapC family toxin [Neorhizobium galegae]
MSYLLDTNVISDLIRNPDGKAGRRVAVLAQGELRTSLIVAAELRYGIAKKGSERLARLVEGVLADFEVLPWEAPADVHYAAVRDSLSRSGQPIGDMDMLIAAHALALDTVLVTDNEREFSRVPGLKVENWLR